MLFRATVPAVKAVKIHLIEAAKGAPTKVRSGHLDESLAAGLGFGTYAALTLRLGETSPQEVGVNDDAFRRRLADFVTPAPALSLAEAVRRATPHAVVAGAADATPAPVPVTDSVDPAVTFMRALDRDYRAVTGLTEQRDAVIAYSRLGPSGRKPLVLGINPGGDPASWPWAIPDPETMVARRWHDYLDSRYPLQAVMAEFLAYVLDTDEDGVRDVPKTNLVYRRSPNTDSFERLHGMTLMEAAREAASFNRRILEFVQPRVIILEGKWCLKAFRRLFCPTGYGKHLIPEIGCVFHGRSQAALIAREMPVDCLGRSVPVIALGYPTRFSRVPEWQEVRIAVRDLLRSLG